MPRQKRKQLRLDYDLTALWTLPTMLLVINLLALTDRTKEDASVFGIALTTVGIAQVVGLIVFVLPKLVDVSERLFWYLAFIWVITFLVVMAQLDLLVAQYLPGSFNGMDSGIDALYFAVATFTTAGSGGPFPLTDAAELFVTGQLIVGFVLAAFLLPPASQRFKKFQ